MAPPLFAGAVRETLILTLTLFPGVIPLLWTG
jgi:hypothetical protein